MTFSWIREFSEGNLSMKDLLGGKGAGLAEMTRIGLHVPPGFTVTTDACRAVMKTGSAPDDLWAEVDEALARLEERSGRSFGHGPDPLLLSVRSGAKFSMPGMMDTVLNLGLNDDVLPDLVSWSGGDEHFAYDAYRRFLQMYGKVVLGLDAEPFEAVLTDLRGRRGVSDDSSLTGGEMEEACRRFRAVIESAGAGVPNDPRIQLRSAIEAVFSSWNNPRAQRYRRINGIPDDLGTAANVQMMVFGDLGDDSGTGVCFTRDPATGERKPFGDFLPRAQGEDVVAGIRNTMSLDDLGRIHPDLHAELLDVMSTLELHTTDMCDIEFTIERGRLWVLQTRSGKRTAPAAVRMAVEMVAEGLIDTRTAIARVDPSALEQLERPRVSETSRAVPLASGVAASPGAAQGEAVFDADRAVSARAEGRRVLLVRPETTPDDIHGMDAADGILTSQGGKTSHAAVVARGMGKPAVTGVAAMIVDLVRRQARIGDVIISEGDPLTIDGTKGVAYAGLLPLVAPEETPELHNLLAWADSIRTLGVRANADTPEDAARARALGAAGIGLARTEHMFMGERLAMVQRVILADDEDDRTAALVDLKASQVGDFEGLLEAMDGLPVIIRLLDPPLHEFLPSLLDIEKDMVDRARHGKPTDDLEALAAKVAVWAEDNPMLGLRGVRLGIVFESLYRIQVEAAVEAVVHRRAAGGDPHLEIMVPLVSTVEELRRMRGIIEGIIASTAGEPIDIPVGTMIELPRAALIASEIAEVADFFSFGTNDLTQMTFGLSRDDAEALFLGIYLDEHLLAFDPFQTIDVAGVGRLMRSATAEGRAANGSLTLGVCGEHGGDPASIAFCREIGLDYVSASPPRIHVARLAAAQAELGLSTISSTA